MGHRNGNFIIAQLHISLQDITMNDQASADMRQVLANVTGELGHEAYIVIDGAL